MINLGSYNYLGFSDCEGPCANAVHKTTEKYGVGTNASRQELGNNTIINSIIYVNYMYSDIFWPFSIDSIIVLISYCIYSW